MKVFDEIYQRLEADLAQAKLDNDPGLAMKSLDLIHQTRIRQYEVETLITKIKQHEIEIGKDLVLTEE